ncbi:MAG: branched-chain amino acid ABC transporter permease [Acidimicrobiaceae bacterium]
MSGFFHYFSSHASSFRGEFWGLLVGGLGSGIIYAMVAIGYTMVYGVLRLINFAHSEIFMVGGFAGFFVLKYTIGSSTPTGFSSVLLIILGILAGGTAGSLIAVLLERVAYRPLRKRGAPKIAYLISAIGASYFLLNLAAKEFGRIGQSMVQPYTDHPVFTIFGAPVQMYTLIIFIVAAIMLVGLDRLVSATKLGRGIRAVAQDSETASLMGVNIDKTIAVTFILGGFLGGVAGFLYAMNVGVLYSMGFTPALKAFTAAVLGGIGNLRGAVLGGVILGVVESFSVAFVDPAYIDVVAFAILILVLMFRPTGILGEQIGRAA